MALNQISQIQTQGCTCRYFEDEMRKGPQNKNTMSPQMWVAQQRHQFKEADTKTNHKQRDSQKNWGKRDVIQSRNKNKNEI